MSTNLYLLYLLTFLTLFSANCKQVQNPISKIPISWEYAESEQHEPLSFLPDKEFKPLDESKINSLATLLPEEKGYIWVRGVFNFKGMYCLSSFFTKPMAASNPMVVAAPRLGIGSTP